MLGFSLRGTFQAMRLLAAKTVPFVAGLRGIRGARPGLAVALIVVGALLAIIAQRLPRLVADVNHTKPVLQAKLGGETVVSKFAQGKTEMAAEPAPPEPASASRLIAMALASVPSATPAPPREQQEPNLAGLSEIPHELIWNRKPDKEKKGSPKAFAAFSKARENLPWDAVKPVPFSPIAPPPKIAKAQAPAPGAKRVANLEPLTLPNDGQIETWLKAKATEIKGVQRTRPLYHFELWLEPPAAVKRRLVGVTYEFSTPAVMPQFQASSDQASGFRISAGGLACADEITLTLRFDNGQSEKVTVDGCKLFS
jgi:hypothetical protein